MKKKLDEHELQLFISSLRNSTTALLIIDTIHCKHSQRLLEDIKVATTLSSPSAGKPVVIHILDVSDDESHAVGTLTWLPGVPCLLANSNVHLGVDAFTKCRELCRSMEGVSIASMSLSR
jgi:hypothetical protein